jgi:predicted DsbA family dithiol-disulfide isomerase
MKVEIWSDIVCPFCYIGKRRLEKALEKFPDSQKIDITWKSFQLNPAMKTEPGKSINEYLAETKGWSEEYAIQANERVTDMAAEEGLEYAMDKAVVANSFDAHRLIQLAKTQGRDDAMEELLFKAYFTQGKNIADPDTLLQLGIDAGLDTAVIKKLLNSDDNADKVEQDIYEARQIGVRGVPFFVFNNQYAVSGAQPVEVFLSALNTSWNEWNKTQGITAST